MDEDFTGFDEGKDFAVMKPAEAAGVPPEEGITNETDSDSGNLVIAEPLKKSANEPKSTEKSPRKRRSVAAENSAPTRTPSSRVKGRGLAYLLAMEKGGSKKQLAKAQAQVDAQDVSAVPPTPEAALDSTMEDAEPGPGPEPEPEPEALEKPVEREVRGPRVVRERIATRDKEAVPKSPTHNVSTPVVKSKANNRKSYGSTNISSPLLKAPFKDGWRREVVYRATVDPGTKTLCDVYYYAPDGKKLRSGREVSEYLDKTVSPYTVENFTFFKEPIGMDAQQEMLRHAKQRKEEGGQQEKLIVKKEKALKAREEELRRNLQKLEELGEDVAAITGTGTTPQSEAEVSEAQPTADVSPARKKKGKAEKPLKIKLFGQGLRSKENAEPAKSSDLQPEPPNQFTTTTDKSSPIRSIAAVPDDISHLFTASKSGGTRSGARNHKVSSIQNLELINGKRFVSVCTSPESSGLHRSPSHNSSDAEHLPVNKRSFPSPALLSPRASPKRLKPSLLPPAARLAAAAASSSGPPTGFGFFSSDHFNNFVSHAYHGLLRVFRYLTVQELMAAAGVCKLWRDLALHHSHWRLVRLKNSRVYDWSLFASHLRRAGTQHLDMRKMLFVTSLEDTWKNLDLAASNLSEILRIDLCKCPSELLETIAKHCLRLKYIDAQTISSSNIGFEHLSNLTQLEELKVRAVSKMMVDGGLEAFSHLKNLKSLSLTTLSNLKADEVKHLVDLPQLENLEIGDCVEWTEEGHYEMLSRLCHLRHLRLEHGPTSASVLNYLTSLDRIKGLQHLELINFTVNAPLHHFQLDGLKRLLVVPRYSQESLGETMRHLLNAIGSMKNLQQVSWVLTEEILNDVDGLLPLAPSGDDEETQDSSLTLEQLQDLLRRRLPQANVRLLRLPEYATHRYSLSMNQED